MRIRAIAAALQRTTGSQWPTGLSFQPVIEWRHTNSRRKRKVRSVSKLEFSVGDGTTMPQKKHLHWTHGIGRSWWRTSTQRMEGRMREIRAWDWIWRGSPSCIPYFPVVGKIRNPWCKQKLSQRQETIWRQPRSQGRREFQEKVHLHSLLQQRGQRPLVLAQF